MFHKFIFAAIAAALLFALSYSPARAQARAQSEVPKVELGVHMTVIDLNEVFEVPGGVGARLGFNFNRHVSFDAEINYFPRKNRCRAVFGASCFGTEAGNFGQTEGLFGVKAGQRFEKLGIFAKVRPGFVHFRAEQITPDFNDQRHHRFALDVGGVLELYPVRHLVIRFDLGDTLIPFGGRTVNGANGPVHLETGLHNFQGGAGIGFRF